MLKNRKLILDQFCEISDILRPYADQEFFDFSKHELQPGAVYVFGRSELKRHRVYIRELVENNVIKAVFSDPAEGSSTIANHCEYMYNTADLIKNKKMLLIAGGDMSPEWCYMSYENFLPKIQDYDENNAAMRRWEEIYQKTHKPYKFIFLNGRFRSHRKYFVEQFHARGILDSSIWSWLESKPGPRSYFTVQHNGQELMNSHRSVKLLDPQYEVSRYAQNINTEFQNHFVKDELFNNEWGDVYLNPDMYIDTYFSMVTETVFDYPYSFRTEKIWKPIAMGHPWIVAANAGYYRDIRNLGFQTFGNLIDESFDLIDNDQDRAGRIAVIVEDLCRQDLASFLKSCYNICKYNRQLMSEKRHRVRQELPQRFFDFLTQHHFDE